MDIITGHICNAARGRRLRTPARSPHAFIRLVKPFERAFYRQRSVRRLIAISRSLETEIREEYGGTKPATVIYHGTDTAPFHPVSDAAERSALRRRFKVPEDRSIWLFMGETMKGLREVIEQLESFPQAHLLVVSRSKLSPYRGRAESLRVDHRMTFRGYEPASADAFRAADVFVYPNDYNPFGLVATEAMATGIPVVLGRAIGAAELVEHGRNGLLCGQQDAASVRKQLARLVANPASARAMGLAARATVSATAGTLSGLWRTSKSCLSPGSSSGTGTENLGWRLRPKPQGWPIVSSSAA